MGGATGLDGPYRPRPQSENGRNGLGENQSFNVSPEKWCPPARSYRLAQKNSITRSNVADARQLAASRLTSTRLPHSLPTGFMGGRACIWLGCYLAGLYATSYVE